MYNITYMVDSTYRVCHTTIQAYWYTYFNIVIRGPCRFDGVGIVFETCTHIKISIQVYYSLQTLA